MTQIRQISKTPKLISQDTNLRGRLLVGSISLAILVSVIFIFVAYKLAKDLSESIESTAANKQVNQIISTLKTITNAKQESDDFTHSVQRSIEGLFLEQDILGLEVWVNDQHIELIPYLSQINAPVISNTIDKQESSSGFMDNNDIPIFWVYQKDLESGLSLLLIYETHAIEMALNYVSSRLSITAFLTFWLVIWAALIISAIISKQVDDNNLKLAYIASHDNLTHLPNRIYLRQRMEKFFSKIKMEAENKPAYTAALLMIDLDKFKDVNDTMGHSAGDQLLVAIAKRLAELINEDDVLVRYGGDEFIIWLEDSNNKSAMVLAENIITACRTPILIHGSQFEIGASIGIVNYPSDGKTIDELIKHADSAMYKAKRLRLGFQQYKPHDRYLD